MPTHYDVPVNELVSSVAKELEHSGAVVAPAWALFVKTGAHKERPPLQKDWWEVRAAAILRKIAIQGPIGVSKLRTHFGGKRNCGMAPARVYKGSGSIIRKILQQLDKAGLTRHTKVGVHSGRVITPKGLRILNTSAAGIAKELGITLAAKLPPTIPIPEEGASANIPTPPAQPTVSAEQKPSKKKAQKKESPQPIPSP